MKKILFTGSTLSETRKSELKKQGYDFISARTDMNEDELIAALSDMDAHIIGGAEIVTERVIERLKDRLKVITFFGTGYEKYIAVEKAIEHNISVTNTPHANVNAVAEFTVALILTAVKKIVLMNAETKDSQWNRLLTWELQGKTIGIIGMGHIGERVARILKFGFGMNVVYHSRTRKQSIETELEAEFVSLHKLCSISDIISLHAQYSNDTIGLIGEVEFSQMKKEAVLINTARADLVDYNALKNALIGDKIAFVAFDGYYEEPVPLLINDKFGLLSMDNSKFVITPHAAYKSINAIKNMEDIAIDNTIRILNGEPCVNVVKKA